MPQQQEVLTDDMAAAIWSGQTASIAGLEETIETQEEKDAKAKAAAGAIAHKVGEASGAAEEDDEDDKEEGAKASKVKIDDKSITEALAGGNVGDEDEDDEDDEEVKRPGAANAKPGRKTSDLVSAVNQLAEEGILIPYVDDEDKPIEVKNIDEAKELIKANLANREEKTDDEVFEKKIKGYSPQIQTILRYAEKGVQSASEIIELIGAIKEVEDVNDLDTTSPEGQEAVVREAYKAKGFKDTYIEKNIKRLKDLNALKEEADELSQELITLKAQEVQRRLVAQQQREQQAMEASKVYFKTVEDTLNKDQVGILKLQKDEKAKIYTALADNRYTSLSGGHTNQFVKTLEDLQFGKKADYEHFLNLVHYTIDPKGFIDKIKQSVKSEATAETVKKLKSSKTTQANTESSMDTSRPKTGIKKGGFVNPFK